MTECQQPGWQVGYSESDNPKRKYPHTWELVQNDLGHWIGVNTLNANRVVREVLEAQALPDGWTYDQVVPEIKVSQVGIRARGL